MTFIPIDKLEPGMMLDKDVNLFQFTNGKVPILKSGQVLTQSYIDQLTLLEIFGAYVSTEDSEDDMFGILSPINQELKQNAVFVVQQIYKSYNKPSKKNENYIKQAMEISKKLVQALSSRDVKLSIGNLRLYDDYIYNHSLGVAMLSIVIGLSLGLEKGVLNELGVSALVHDIGKASIPIDIIKKHNRLTPDEFELVKQHPEKGAKFISKYKQINQRIIDGVLTHHEKFNGNGYPKKLKEKDIPLFGRIIAVADVFDALTSRRPYRQSNSAREAIEYIMGSSGSAFDIDIVRAFLKKVAPYPTGSCVKLSNGEIAIIVEQNELQPLRPVIHLLNKPDERLDLFHQPELQTVIIEDICNISPDQLIKN